MLLVFASGISYAILMGLPFSIAYFYEKVFKKHAFPYLFVVSGILFLAYIIFFYNDIFSITGTAIFAISGIILAAASLRLYVVMTGGD